MRWGVCMAKTKATKKKTRRRSGTKKIVSADGGQKYAERVQKQQPVPPAPKAEEIKKEAKKRPFDFLRPETQKKIGDFKSAEKGAHMTFTLRTGRDAEYYTKDIQKILGEGFSIKANKTGERYKVKSGEHKGKELDVYEVTITKVTPVSKEAKTFTPEALLESINIQISSLSKAENETAAASELHNNLIKAWIQVKEGEMEKGLYYKLWADAAEKLRDPILKKVFQKPALVEDKDNPGQEVASYLAAQRKKKEGIQEGMLGEVKDTG